MCMLMYWCHSDHYYHDTSASPSAYHMFLYFQWSDVTMFVVLSAICSTGLVLYISYLSLPFLCHRFHIAIVSTERTAISQSSYDYLLCSGVLKKRSALKPCSSQSLHSADGQPP